jgi:hypothetical protein
MKPVNQRVTDPDGLPPGRTTTFGSSALFFRWLLRLPASDEILQESFLDHVAVRVLHPGLVADRSQVLDKPQCMLRVVRMDLRGSASSGA